MYWIKEKIPSVFATVLNKIVWHSLITLAELVHHIAHAWALFDRNVYKQLSTDGWHFWGIRNEIKHDPLSVSDYIIKGSCESITLLAQLNTCKFLELTNNSNIVYS